MEIKVGGYVRCKDGIIAKIINILEENYGDRGNILYELDKETFDDTEGFEEHSVYALPDQFVKHSNNIIDLIECGDYVNGRLVLQVDYKNKNVCLLIPLTDTKANTNIMWYGYEDIKSVATKKQFSSLEYII